MRWYTLPGWPSQVAGHAAAMPNLTRVAAGGAVQYKDGVTGWPGTVGVPSLGNKTAPSPDWGDIAQMGVSRSVDAPDYNYPNLYYARPERDFWPGAGMPVSRESDNLMPIPATDPRSVPAPLAVPLAMRGNQQIAQPASLIQWPAWRGTPV